MKRELDANRSLLVCMALYWMWQISFFQNPALLSHENGIQELDATACLLSSSAITYLLGWKFDAPLARLAKTPAYPYTLGAAMFIGSVVSTWASPLVIWAAAGMGIGAALFIMEFGRALAQTGSRTAFVCGIAGILLGSVGYFLGVFLPEDVFKIIICTLPLLAACALAKTSSRYGKAKYYRTGESDFRFPFRFAATCFMQGISISLMSFLVSAQSILPRLDLLYLLAYLTGCVVLCITIIPLQMDFNRLTYRIGLPLMACGFTLSVCLPTHAEFSAFVLASGYCFMYVIITCICAYFGHSLGFSPARISAISTLFLIGGQLTGMALALLLSSQQSSPPTSIAAFAAFIILVASLFFFDANNPQSGWGAIRPGASPTDSTEESLAAVAQKYNLTPRETEITALLFRGRNKERISEELGLSKETIKTHMGNIYRKLFIHSQQELIDLIEKEKESQNDIF